MADAAGAAVGGAFDLAGAGIEAWGQGKQNEREAAAAATSARTLDDVIKKYVLASDTTGLERSAVTTLTKNQGILDASLAQRGIYSSGTATSAHRGLAGEVMSGLAEAINADQANRAGMAMQGYSQPGFGFYDTRSGQATNQGK